MSLVFNQEIFVRNWIVTLIITAVSTIAAAATPLELSQSQRWAIQNVLDGERYAILINGKANIIDTPDITRLHELYERFYVNEIAILQKYKDKPRLLSFPVGRVAIENGEPVVYGAGASPTVRYVFDTKSMDALSKVGKGSLFAAVCTLKSITRSALEFTKCRTGQEYIDSHVTARRLEIMEFLSGKPARRAETAKYAVTILSLINSMPIYSECLKEPNPDLICLSRIEFEGKSVIKPGAWEAVTSDLRSRGYQL